jgi:hypothetical protein
MYSAKFGTSTRQAVGDEEKEVEKNISYELLRPLVELLSLLSRTAPMSCVIAI